MSVEDTYIKLDEQEHVLARPDSYVGACTNVPRPSWTFSFEKGLEWKECPYVEGVTKIFDEIVVNSADHKTRNPKTMTYLAVTINATTNTICVKNNGPGVPVELHTKYNEWVPELIFGSFRTSSNLKDAPNVKRLTGGRNGLGAKLTNVFSTRFKVTTTDTNTCQKFSMEWKDHMKQKSKPKIQKVASTARSSTSIEFQPDLSLFDLSSLSQVEGILAKRLLDIAGTSAKLSVKLNNQPLPVRGFKQYCECVAKAMGVEASKVAYVRTNERWEIGLCASPKEEAVDISFVNHICTSNGGTHVRAVRACLETELRERMQKHMKGTIPLSRIRANLCIFVNCMIENPTFGSQTKLELHTRSANFGMRPGITHAHYNKLFKDSDIASVVEERAKGGLCGKAPTTTKSRSVNIPNLHDANWAGTKKSCVCRLFVTEGESAKTLAISGREKAGGADRNGVYPVRGKLYNPCAASKNDPLSIVAHKSELKALTMALNLKPKGFDYAKEGTTSLRYGTLVIMTDQDTDGAHIAGLIVNFLRWYNPSILEVPGFLQQFVTPVLKVALPRKRPKSFFSLQTFEAWAKVHTPPRTAIKYYKGLGTSTAKEAKEYFSQMSTHLIPFAPCTLEQAKQLEIAFSGRCKVERKAWIETKGGDATEEPDFTTNPRTLTNFLDTSLMEYNMSTLERAIPRFSDGLKQVQRKVLYTMLVKKMYTSTKVTQVQSRVAEVAEYHHGETSMYETIIKMAQTFVGSNNLNLLYPDGQFGTRLQNGADAASPRYIFTMLEKVARLIFPEADDLVLDYVVEEGKEIQPHNFAPILPMVLVNGSAGIATGWSTNLPMYNPIEVIHYLLQHLSKSQPSSSSLECLRPWYRGFVGTIHQAPNGYTTRGVYTFEPNCVVHITELPIGVWTEPYLKAMLAKKDGKHKSAQNLVVKHRDNSSEVNVDIHFTLTPARYDHYVANITAFEKDFKLVTDLNMTNIHLLDLNGKVRKYKGVEDILTEFIAFRHLVYQKRKARQLELFQLEHEELEHRIVFVRNIVNETIPLLNVPKEQTFDAMTLLGIPSTFHTTFLSMQLSSLHAAQIQSLEKKAKALKTTIEQLTQTSVEELWATELHKLLEYLDPHAKSSSSSSSKRKQPSSGSFDVSVKKSKESNHTK